MATSPWENQLSNDVDSELIQNSQRSGKKEEAINGLCTAMEELIVGIGENRQAAVRSRQKFASVDQKNG